MEEFTAPDPHEHDKVITPDLSKFETFEQITYRPTSVTARPAKHVYGVEADGRRRHLSHDAVLSYYGYADHITPAQDYRLRQNLATQPSAAAEVVQAAAIVEPQPVKAERHNRARDWLLTSSVAVTTVPNRIVDAYRNRETRRRAIVLTAGVVALGVVAGWAVYRYGFAGQAPSGRVAEPGGAPLPRTSVPEPHTAPNPVAGVPRPRPAPVRTESVVRLPAYDPRTGSGTIWNGVKQYASSLGFRHLRSPAVERLTQATLRYNHLSWREARHLAVGYPVRMLSRAALKGILS